MFKDLSRHLFPLFIFVVAALAVALPLLAQGGQIFLLDLVFPPHLDVDMLRRIHLGAMLPVMAVLTFLGSFVSTGVAMKVLMMVVLMLPMWSMYLLLSRETKRAYAIAGGLLFLFNPFMYERFVAGHWFVMLGLGYLPLVIYYLRRTLATHDYRHTALFALLFAAYPLISLHYAYIGGGLVLLYTLVHIAHRKRKHIFSKRYALHGALFLAIILLVNSFWLLGFFKTGGTFQRIDDRDFATFVTKGDTGVGVYANVLALNGFWREGLVLPKDLIPLWYVPSLIILFLAVVGLALHLKRRDRLAIALIIATPVVLVLSVGYATPFTEAVTRFAIRFVPGFSGLRETAKLVGILAFIYAYCAPLGMDLLEKYVFAHILPKRIAPLFGAAILIVCAFATSFPLLWGAAGQVAVADYPPSFAVVDANLAGKEHGKVLVFPWRGYLEVQWAKNMFLANPAGAYFSFPVETAVSINNVAYDEKYTSPYDEFIPLDKSEKEIAIDMAMLKKMGVTDVILLKTSDWQRYTPILSDTKYFEADIDRADIALYRLK